MPSPNIVTIFANHWHIKWRTFQVSDIHFWLGLSGVTRQSVTRSRSRGTAPGLFGGTQFYFQAFNFTFQTFKSQDNAFYLICVPWIICLNTSQGFCKWGMSVCSESWRSGVGEAAAARDTRHYYPWKHSQEGGDGDLWKWICVLDPLLLLLPPLLLMCRGMCVHKHLRRYLRKTSYK